MAVSIDQGLGLIKNQLILNNFFFFFFGYFVTSLKIYVLLSL